MSAVPVDPKAETRERSDLVDRIRLKLLDAAADVKPLHQPLPSIDDLMSRVEEVKSELRLIIEDLELLIHVSRLETGDFEATLQALDDRLADGWVPEGSDVASVIERLGRAGIHK